MAALGIQCLCLSPGHQNFGYVPTLGWNFQVNASVHVLEWRDQYHMILTSFLQKSRLLKNSRAFDLSL